MTQHQNSSPAHTLHFGALVPVGSHFIPPRLEWVDGAGGLPLTTRGEETPDTPDPDPSPGPALDPPPGPAGPAEGTGPTTPDPPPQPDPTTTPPKASKKR